MVKITISGDQILTYNFDFRGHISTFRAENTPKSKSFKAENNAQTTSEQLQTNFQKVQKTTFLAPKMVKSRIPILKKWRKFHPKISILVVLRNFFGSILDASMGRLSPKTIPKLF